MKCMREMSERMEQRRNEMNELINENKAHAHHSSFVALFSLLFY